MIVSTGEALAGTLVVCDAITVRGGPPVQSGAIHMEIKVLHAHGWSVSRLAREFGLSRTTIRRELASEGPRRYSQRSKPTALSDAQRAHVERRLAMCPILRGTVLYHELRREYGYRGSYPAFIRHLRTLRPVAATEPVVRFETAPWVQLQADWAHLGVWPLAEAEDGMADLYALVAILGYSRVPAVRLAVDHTRSTTLERLVRCLDDLGGVPKEILTDRDPVFCIGQTSDGKAILAPEWVDLCQVLDVVPGPAGPIAPRPRARWSGWSARSRRASSPGWAARSCPPRRRWPTTTGWRCSGATSSSCRGATAPLAR